MREDLSFVVKNFIWFVISGLFCAGVIGLIFLDIHFFKGVPERKIVECTQEIFLLVSVVIFLYSAWKNKNGGLWLVGGFLACMYIRELDIVFDKVFHGAWFYVALIVAFICIFKAWQEGVEKSVHDLAVFMRNRVFSKLSCGLLIVLVYSRLIGYGPLWRLVMKKHYLRNVKTIVEEGTELFGYSIIFLAAVEYACYFLSQKEEQK